MVDEEREAEGEEKVEENKDDSEKVVAETDKTEVKIDNNPDKVDFGNVKEKMAENPWMIATVVLGAAVLILLFMNFKGGVTGNVIAGDVAGNNLVDYLNTVSEGGVEYLSYEDLGSNLYAVIVEYQGNEVPVFVTKDGEYFVQGAVPLSGQVVSDGGSQPLVDVPKSDVPEVELFIMTHCPYGTQAEKGMIPVLELLGDKIDGNIRFVHYFMHEPEETETPVQICIREEQSDKYLDYLRCFLEDGDGERCLSEVGIDEVAMNTCIDTNYEGLYASDSELSEGYGVRGSPSLVINGVLVQSGRSPAAYLEIICSAFNEAPEECDEILSLENPKPMWGWDSDESAGSTGQC